MIIEDHKISKPKGESAFVTITGRSYETVLERRLSVNNAFPLTGSRPTWNIAATKDSDAAYLALRIVLGDEPRYQDAALVLPLTNPASSPLDAIPQLDLTLPLDYVDILNVNNWNSATSYSVDDRVKYIGYIWRAVVPNLNQIPSSLDPSHWERLTTWSAYEIKPQNLYSAVTDLLNTNHRGLKAVRPVQDKSKVGIEIYNGADLTETVVFDVRFDQFDASTYLLSAQGSTNVGYVYGSNGAQVVLKTAAPEPSGLDRRLLLVDQSSDETTSTPEVRKSRGLIELYKYNATALFDGEISDQVASGYNIDYFLGDILKLTGEYGLSQNARVAEFIRVSDVNGNRAYPTFEAVDD